MKRAVEDLMPEDAVNAAHEAFPNVATIGMHLTDMGNAERLVARFRDRIRFCPPRRKWLMWDGRRWGWDETGQILRYAKKTVRAIYAEAEHARDDDAAKAIAKHASKSEEGARLKAMVSLAESEPGIPVMPSQLDADPWVLNVLNGTINLRTGELRKHRKADLITKMAPVEYDPNAKLEVWDKFIHDATGGDEELAGYLQRVAGYALTGSASEKKFFFIYGPRDTAKSTFVDALTAAWGGYAETADFATWLEQTVSGGNRGDLVRLAGARLVSSVEVKKGKRWDEALIKRVVGGDVITAAAKYEAEVSFRATFKILLAANDAPGIREDDDGMWARMQRVPFTRQIAKKDPVVKATLSDPEKAGAAVLAWAVKGCLDWQRQGLGTAKAVEESTAAYHAENDQIAGFFAECCVFEPWDEVKVSRAELRKAYEDWCRENGIRHPLSATEFAARLRAEGAIDGRSHGIRVWKRVRLLGLGEEPSGSPGSPGDTSHENFSTRAQDEELYETGDPVCPPCPPDEDEDEERAAIQEESGVTP